MPSASGESLDPQPRSTHGTASDVLKAGTIISEVHRDVVDTKAMIHDVLKSQQDVSSQDRLVSDACALFAIG